MADACDDIVITVNNYATYNDGTGAPITINAAGPSAGGSGGTLTPTKMPIPIVAGGTQSFSAASSKGSGGWAKGSITIQCMYAQNSSSSGTPEVLVVDYSGAPSTIKHGDLCTATCTGSASSAHFTVTGTAVSGVGTSCVITFAVMSGVSSSTT